LGLGYSVNENWIIDIAYKYFATEDPDFEGTKAEYKSNNITIGMRYAF
jgi:opacity protein-like surface antigen